MNKYSMTCSCGHMTEVDAESKEEAIKMIQDKMTDEAIAAHMEEKHAGEPMMEKAQVHAMVAQQIQEVVPAAA